LKAMSRKLAKGGATTGSSKLWKPAHPWFTGCAKQLVKKASSRVEPQAARDACRCSDFYGEKEAKLIALACSKPPKDARADLAVVGEQVVELGIVDRASDSTIGRALKKNIFSPSPPALGHPAEGQQRVRSRYGRRAAVYTRPATAIARWFASTKPRSNSLPKRACHPDESGTPGPFRL